MPKKRSARKHRVKAQVHNIDLTKAGSSMLLEVFSAGEKIGTVEIGRGSLRWYGRHRTTPKTIAWSKLADWMDSI